jgi:membrane protease YdiL (CAAX protease family)
LTSQNVASEEAITSASLAPRWHTAALIALLLCVALTGTLLQHYGASSGRASAALGSVSSRILGQYAPLLLVNWGLCAYCCVLFRERNALPQLLGLRWHNARRTCGDLALAGGGFLLIMIVEFVSARLFAAGQNAAIARLLPSTVAERLTWVLVALSVGFCEEVVYRGYLQSQLTAFSASRAVGVIGQALLFGLAHLEQGPALALRIGTYGLVFGLLAQFRRSLLPGIVCHVLVDLAAVFLH